jgi:hypothetical protein
VLAAAASGCSHAPSDAQSSAAPTSQPAAEQTAVVAPPTAAAQASAAPQAGATAAAPVDAGIASTDGDQSGTKFVVESLVRSGDTVTLKYSLVNGSAKAIVANEFVGSGYNGYRTMSGIHLIDTVGKKKYFPIEDTDHNCICSQDVDDIAPGARATLWGKYPAPPPNVTKISIEVPHFIPLDGVPITQ